MDVVQTSLSLFAPPATDKTIVKEYWVDYNPIAAITEGGVIEFNVPGTSVDYISLGKSRLHIKYVITDEEGKKISDERTIDGDPTPNTDQVAPVNFTLHSIFRQIDLSLNQKVVSPDVGVNYPYKALIDLLLGSSNDMILSQAQAAMYFKDQAGHFDELQYIGSNSGYSERGRPTKDGDAANIEGCLYLDISQGENRAILNGVSVNLKLFQALNDFRLMRLGTKNYKLVITSAVWKVCYISLDPNMILAHDEALKISPALYPFWRSDIKSFSVAKGSLNFMTDNIYHGTVPSKLIIGMVSNTGYSGDYSKNPFDFQHMNLNYLEVTVDGQPVPNRALTPNFEKGDFVSSYLSLLDNDYNRKNGIIIKLLEYDKGYTLFLFDIQSYLSGHIMSKGIKGHIRLTMRFSKALSETINNIIYGKFPETLSIDHSRNVNLGA